MFVLALPLLAAGAAQAADAPFVIADASGNARRFMPLKPSGPQVVSIHNGLKSTALRSDRAALSNGFMRIDRAMARPAQNFRAVKTTPASQPVKVILGDGSPRPGTASGADADITSLFDGGAESSDFRQALSGTRVAGHAWPLPASAQQHVSSGYGRRADPFTGKPAFHGGLDVAAPTGTPVLASADGTVTRVERQGRFGNFVAVQHRDGTESMYGHLSRQSVHVGQRVAQGQKVGEVGATGRATGPHLDYRIKKNGELINPLAYLRAPSATRVALR